VQQAPPNPVHVERRDVSYLLEDDPPRKSPLVKIVIVVVLAAAGLFVWRQLRPTPAATSQIAEVGTNPTPDHQPSPTPQTSVQQPQATPVTTPTPQVDTPSVAAPGSESHPEEASATPASTPEPSAAPENRSPDEPTKEASPARPEPVRAEPVRPVAKPAPKPKPATPVDPVKQAEAFLYGRGVAKDCDKAVSLLKSAADKSNVRARSTLGSMYATGHCVSRDLPTAYRYFALVLRTDPENTTASQNLQSIWQQMTPPERQAATK
jgi:Sel1 repeat-containing protein